ncbi:MAG: helix-turn-helix transcriptional regulator [Bacteroidales bacterium]|nr:helix-turn-helix transcriptional regulator [Bacteroidales bacterium]
MKQKLSLHFLARALSLAVVPVLLLCDLLSSGALAPGDVCIDIWWALQVLMLYPTSRGPVIPALQFGGLSVTAAVCFKLLGAPPGWHVTAGAAVVVASMLLRCRLKFAQVPPLFHVSAVWLGVEDHCSLIHDGICLWAGMMVLVLSGSVWGSWACAGVLAGWYAVQYWRVYTRSTLLLGRDKEELIRKTQRGSAYRQPIQYVDTDSRSGELFNEVVRIMETRRPWLQDDFSIEDLARLTRTNRMYLSKAINFHSGRNFNQLVNFYRIRYAVELIKKDTSLKMNDVSAMCGFHTVVSFNMAFKLNERMTPTEFLQSLKKLN